MEALKLETLETLNKKDVFFSAEQVEKQEEFLESKCDLFDSNDFNYYATATGKGLDWVRENAKYSDENGMYGSCLENAIIDGDFELAEFFI